MPYGHRFSLTKAPKHQGTDNTDTDETEWPLFRPSVSPWLGEKQMHAVRASDGTALRGSSDGYAEAPGTHGGNRLVWVKLSDLPFSCTST